MRFACRLAAFAALALARCVCASGDERWESESSEDPLVFYTRYQIKPLITFPGDGGTTYTQLQRAYFPFHTDLIPGVPSGQSIDLVRVDLPFIYQDTPSATGWSLQDFVLLALTGFKTSRWAIGGGLSLSLPAATTPSGGSGKWSAGPSLGFTYHLPPSTKLSLLAQQFFSFAGEPTRKSVNQLQLQPIVQQDLPARFYLFSDPVFKFDWNSGSDTIPVNLQLGKAFTQRLSASIGPEYTTSQGDWAIRMTLTYLPD